MPGKVPHVMFIKISGKGREPLLSGRDPAVFFTGQDRRLRDLYDRGVAVPVFDDPAQGGKRGRVHPAIEELDVEAFFRYRDLCETARGPEIIFPVPGQAFYPDRPVLCNRPDEIFEAYCMAGAKDVQVQNFVFKTAVVDCPVPGPLCISYFLQTGKPHASA